MDQQMNFYRTIVWCICQLIATALMLYTLASCIHWLEVMPISEAPENIAAQLPASCPAFVELGSGNKYGSPSGKYVCRWSGSIQTNPQGFVLCIFEFVSLLAFLVYTSLTGRGFKLRPDTSSADAEAGRGNIFEISEIDKGSYGHLMHFVEIIMLDALLALILILVIALDMPMLIKLSIGIGILIYMLSISLLVRSVLLNRERKTATIAKRIFGRWTVMRREISILDFNSIKIRQLPSRYSIRLQVELIGSNGLVLRLKEYALLKNARSLRDAVAKWGNFQIVSDPNSLKLG